MTDPRCETRAQATRVRLGRHETAALTWLVAYPLITGLLLLLDPLLGDLSLPLRTLVLTGLMVPIMAYWAMPFAVRLHQGVKERARRSVSIHPACTQGGRHRS
ncbi:MAG: hypothetical protein AAFP68_06195 [Pseudomonadota bacterium]